MSSGMPSVAATEPIEECPIGAKEFVLKYSNRKNDDDDGQRRTWYVKDACTGDTVVSCMPCASSSSRASAAVYDQSDHNDRYLQNINEMIPNALQLQKVSRECIPSDGAYIFVVESTESSDECCGFDASEFVVTFDDVVVAFAGENGNSIGTSSNEMKVQFGQSGAPQSPCASNSPSEAQAGELSASPSATVSVPTISLSSSTPSSSTPSSSPSTKNPTLPPTTKKPIFSQAEDHKKDNEGDSTGLQRPEIEQPNTPTLRPTCNNDQDFNLCLAVDMSSSICISDGSCIGCPSDTCRDEFVTESTCCNNFAFIKGFASLMIRSLSNFPADKTFSVVQFATDGRLVSMMNSHVEALSTIDQLFYTGGITNHAEAISLCRQSLSASIAFQQAASGSVSSASATPRKSVMMLITDGVPTTPENDPEGAAMSEAIKAKEENGVFIIPVFISPRYDEDALSFMRGLSSDDKVFDVVDYESLETLKDRLLEEVSCSFEPRM